MRKAFRTVRRDLEKQLKRGVKCWYCKKPYYRLCDFIPHTNGRFAAVCYLCAEEWIKDGRPN